MTACRPGTRSGRSSSRRPSRRRSTSSAARCLRSPTIRQAPTFANTIEALDRAGRRLDRVGSLFGVMTSNMSNPQYQALQREWGPRLAAASDEIVLNRGPLPAHPRRLRGAGKLRPRRPAAAGRRPAATRPSCAAAPTSRPSRSSSSPRYNQQLARLFAEFSEKVLHDEETHIVAAEAELAGVPADVRNAAAAAARERNLPAGQFAIVNTR